MVNAVTKFCVVTMSMGSVGENGDLTVTQPRLQRHHPASVSRGCVTTEDVTPLLSPLIGLIRLRHPMTNNIQRPGLCCDTALPPAEKEEETNPRSWTYKRDKI